MMKHHSVSDNIVSLKRGKDSRGVCTTEQSYLLQINVLSWFWGHTSNGTDGDEGDKIIHFLDLGVLTSQTYMECDGRQRDGEVGHIDAQFVPLQC